MGKANHGRGYLVLRGKKWYGYPNLKVKDPITGKLRRDRKPIILGEKSKMSKAKAREELDRQIAKRKGWFHTNNRIMNDGTVSLTWFVINRFYPLKQGDWREETAKNKKSLIQTNLLDILGEIPLVNFDRFVLQLHVNQLAATCSKDTVLQMCAYMRAIFAEAVDQDFLIKDPALRLKTPTQLRATDKTTLTWEQLRMALNLLTAGDRILMELDMTDALRPGELFALRWRCFDAADSSLNLQETVYKGKIRPWGKTKKALSKIHIPELLSVDLEAWKEVCPDSSPDAFIFPSETGGFLDTDNYRNRVLGELAKTLNLPKLNFQIIRRTIATLSQTKGTVKDTQGLLRHERVQTSTDVYMQVVPEGVQQMVNSIHSELRAPAGETSKKAVLLRPSKLALPQITKEEN